MIYSTQEYTFKGKGKYGELLHSTTVNAISTPITTDIQTTVPLNTISYNDDNIITNLNNNIFTLKNGFYYIKASTYGISQSTANEALTGAWFLTLYNETTQAIETTSLWHSFGFEYMLFAESFLKINNNTSYKLIALTNQGGSSINHLAGPSTHYVFVPPNNSIAGLDVRVMVQIYKLD